MADKEIGELWLNPNRTWIETELIIKLLQERNITNDDWSLTLAQFGIPQNRFDPSNL